MFHQEASVETIKKIKNKLVKNIHFPSIPTRGISLYSSSHIFYDFVVLHSNDSGQKNMLFVASLGVTSTGYFTDLPRIDCCK